MNRELCSHSRSNSREDYWLQCPVQEPVPTSRACHHGPVQVLVRPFSYYRWVCRRRRTVGSEQLARRIRALQTHSWVVKARTERSWNAEDLKRNPTEYTYHTTGKLANCAAFKSQGKGPKSANPDFPHITNYLF